MSTIPPFSLRWNNYLRHITNAFDSLRSQEDLVDVTLCCEGRKIRAHKMLLSACSTYFKEIFKENPCQHPVIVFKNVKYEDLNALIEFIYQGEVRVEQADLPSFLKTAEILSIQGLIQGNGMDGYGYGYADEIIDNTDNSAKPTATTVPIKITAILDSTSKELFEIPSETITTSMPKETETHQQQPPKVIVKKYFSTSLQKQNPQKNENESELERQGMVQDKCGTGKKTVTPKRSGVWLHYKDIRSIEKARCCTCSKIISYKGGGISNLRKHLTKKHPHLRSATQVIQFCDYNEEQIEAFTSDKDSRKGLMTEPESRNQTDSVNNLKRSGVWFHFKVIGGTERARCCTCSKILSYKGGGVSNLKKHLIKKHPNIDINATKCVNDNVGEQPEKQFNPVSEDTDTSNDSTDTDTSKKQTDSVINLKRSGVWFHFKDIGGTERARCCVCSKILSYKGGGVSNLKKHLIHKHPHIDINARKCVNDSVGEQPEKQFNPVSEDTDTSNDSTDTDTSKKQTGETDYLKMEIEYIEATNALEECRDSDRYVLAKNVYATKKCHHSGLVVRF